MKVLLYGEMKGIAVLEIHRHYSDQQDSSSIFY